MFFGISNEPGLQDNMTNSVIKKIVLFIFFGIVVSGCALEDDPSVTDKKDIAKPVLTEITAISTLSSNTKPNYTFNSTEEGTITYSGSCTSTTTSSVSGNNTLILNTLSDGTYSDCTISVTDESGNISSVLLITTFTIDTTTPTIGASIAAVVNFVCNIIGVYFWGSYGIATGTVISGLTLTIFCFVYLNKKHDVIFYGKKYLSFLYRYVFQLATSVILFYISHFFIFKYLQQTPYSDFFTAGLGYWLFTIPLFLLTMVFMFFTKRLYKIKIYFLDI